MSDLKLLAQLYHRDRATFDCFR